MPTQTVSIEIEKYKPTSSSQSWELPAWGHPLGRGVLPLFIEAEDHLFPIGTAFTIGRSPSFVVTAAHNIYETFRHERRLAHLLHARELPSSIDLKQVGLFVLLHQLDAGGRMKMVLLPLENVQAAPPTDVVFGYPQFQSDIPTLVHRLSFDLPSIGEKVWSVGYAGFRFPANGIPLAAVRDHAFDWQTDYAHTLLVVEGHVQRIFTQRFAKGFVDGACFTFDAEISHAQSGGPVLSTDGTIRGINSAGATSFFDGPTSIAAMLYPLLFINLKFGLQMGGVRLNAVRPLVDLVAQGAIPTDGSEERVMIGYDEEREVFYVNPRTLKATSAFVHDDFAGFQAGRKATRETRKGYRLRRTEMGS